MQTLTHKAVERAAASDWAIEALASPRGLEYTDRKMDRAQFLSAVCEASARDCCSLVREYVPRSQTASWFDAGRALAGYRPTLRVDPRTETVQALFGRHVAAAYEKDKTRAGWLASRGLL